MVENTSYSLRSSHEECGESFNSTIAFGTLILSNRQKRNRQKRKHQNNDSSKENLSKNQFANIGIVQLGQIRQLIGPVWRTK